MRIRSLKGLSIFSRLARPLVLVMTLTAICFVVVYRVSGFHYEMNDDAIMELIFRGLLFPEVGSREIGFAHQVTASLFGWLYHEIPQFPWYGASMYLFSIAAVTGILFTVDRLLGHQLGAWQRAAILVVFFVVFLGDSVVLLNFTRVAILLAGASVLTLHRTAGLPGARSPALWTSSFLFSLAVLTRPEGAVLSLIAIGGFVLLVSRPDERRRLALSLGILAALAAGLAARQHLLGREAHFRAVYPYLVNIRDFNWATRAGLSPEDTLRLRAVNAWLFCDRDTVNVGFLSRVASESSLTSDKLQWQHVTRSLAGIGSNLGPGGWPLFIANGWVLVLALMRSKREERERVLRHVAAHALFWMIVVSVAIFMRTLPRVLSPLVALYACASFITLTELGLPLLRAGVVRVAIAAIAVLALLGAYVAPSLARDVMSVSQQAQQANEQFLHGLRDRLQDALLILPRPAFRAFSYLDPLKGVPLDASNRYVVLSGWPCLLAAYERDAESLAGSSRLPDLLNALQRHGAVILSNDQQNAILESYLSTIHGQKVSFSRRSRWMAVGAGTKHRLRLYDIAITDVVASPERRPAQ